MQCYERFSNLSTSKDLNLSQMTELLSLPAEQTQEFIEAKEAEGKPVEDMTVRTLRKEIDDWKGKADAAEANAESRIAEAVQEAAKARQEAEAANARADDAERMAERAKERARLSCEEADRWEAEAESLRQEKEELENREPETVEGVPEDYETLKADKRRLESEKEVLESQKEELELRVASFTAHKAGQTLNEYARLNEKARKFAADEKATLRTAEKVTAFLNALDMLPNVDIEMKEWARCHLHLMPDPDTVIRTTTMQLDRAIRRLAFFRDVLNKKTGLELVK